MNAIQLSASNPRFCTRVPHSLNFHPLAWSCGTCGGRFISSCPAGGYSVRFSFSTKTEYRQTPKSIIRPPFVDSTPICLFCNQDRPQHETINHSMSQACGKLHCFTVSPHMPQRTSTSTSRLPILQDFQRSCWYQSLVVLQSREQNSIANIGTTSDKLHIPSQICGQQRFKLSAVSRRTTIRKIALSTCLFLFLSAGLWGL